MAKLSALEKRVAAVEEARCAALCTRDIRTLKKLLDDEITYGHSSGDFQSKDQILERVANPNFRYVFFSIITRHVRRRAGMQSQCATAALACGGHHPAAVGGQHAGGGTVGVAVGRAHHTAGQQRHGGQQAQHHVRMARQQLALVPLAKAVAAHALGQGRVEGVAGAMR